MEIGYKFDTDVDNNRKDAFRQAVEMWRAARKERETDQVLVQRYVEVEHFVPTRTQPVSTLLSRIIPVVTGADSEIRSGLSLQAIHFGGYLRHWQLLCQFRARFGGGGAQTHQVLFLGDQCEGQSWMVQG